MVKLILKENSGLTIVELMIAMVIMLLVMGISYNFLFLNLRAYETGDNLAEVQFDVRMAAEKVTKELRNVKEISFEEANIDNPQQLDVNSLQDQSPSVTYTKFEVVKEGATYVVVFKISGNNTNLENDYVLNSSVLLHNVNTVDGDTFDDASSITSETVYYKHFE